MLPARSILAALAGLATTAAALAGCPAPAAPPGAAASPGASARPGGAGTSQASPGLPTLAGSPAAPTAAAALGRSLGEGLADERDLADYGYIFDDGSGIVAAGGGNMVAAGGGNMVAAGGGNMVAAGGGNVIVNNAGNYGIAGGRYALLQGDDPAEVDAPQLAPALGAIADAARRDALRARRAEVARKAAARLAARPDRQAFVDAVAKAEVKADAKAGTKTYSFTAALPWKGFTRQVRFLYTVDAATNMLVHGYAAVLRPRPARPRKPYHQVRREFTLLEGGAFKVTYFQATPLLQKKLRRVVSWEKTVAADGQVTGSGAIAWRPLGDPLAAPVRSVPIAVSGREEAEAFRAAEAGAEAVLDVAIDASVAATAKEAGGAAVALDLEAVPAEAAPEDPAQPTTL